ncbi:MAG: hypothetical protein AAGF24_06825, partial [Cyanobacteria bacterium P01_H01_bin.121]
KKSEQNTNGDTDMRFKPEHKGTEGFDALRWVLDHCKLSFSKPLDDGEEWGPVNYDALSFDGKLPHRMHEAIWNLADLGYKHPNSVDRIINVDWTSGNVEHRVSISFAKRRSQGNEVNVSYDKFTYLNGLPAQLSA